MNPAQLLLHFDRISEAPDAIPRLRNFILDLAVRGKLVEQEHPNDDWLSELKQDKQRVLRELNLSRHPEATTPLDSEFPFQVPKQWARLRLSDLLFNCKTGYGEDPEPNLVNVGVVKVGNINNEGRFTGTFGLRGFSQREVDGLLARQKDFIIVKSSGSAENVHSGKAALCSAEHDGKLIATNFTLRLRLFSSRILPEFVWRLLNSPVCRDWVAKAVQTLTYPNLTWSDYGGMPVALPPLAEQHRIVAKVDELMALCDRLEAARNERESRRARLTAAALHHINAEASAETFRSHSHFYVCHLSRLTTHPDQIRQLRETILNLAFHGHLVPQRLDEGSGSHLLERLAAAHPEHRKLGRPPRQDRPSSDSSSVPGLYEVPSAWAWSSLDFICDQIADVDHQMPKAVAHGVPFISAKDLKDDGTIDFSAPKMISEEDYKRLSRKVQMRRGDIVYSRIGARLGKARLVEVDTRFLISYSCCLVRPLPEFVDKCYIQLFLNSTMALRQAHRGTQSIGVPDLGLGEIKAFRIPIPPLVEQQRIVARVKELMALCDRLEAHLTLAQTESRRLLEAVLHKALAPLAA
jgi:type I restriction enzyme S subunit